ncbi:hypothetical protein LTR94_023514, partial [Friedmanniomyces endolithicus]
MSDLKMNKEDDVESYEFATPEAIEEALKTGKLSQTVFGTGCFWGPDSNFGGTPGVVQTRVGYAGASTLDPSYRNIKGHAEVVRVIYDKDQISYRELLGGFESWFVHVRKQGQYRQILFVFDQEQKQVTEELIQAIGKDKSPEVIEAGQQNGYFWPAEDYHQKHRLRRNKQLVSLAEVDFGPRWDEHL